MIQLVLAMAIEADVGVPNQGLNSRGKKFLSAHQQTRARLSENEAAKGKGMVMTQIDLQ